MNLKQLKGMIAEEYRYWLAEQPIDEPGIEVGPNDVDAMGGGDSEATLKQIFDMLKAYFEGGAGGEMPAAPVGDTPGEDMGDMGDMDDADMGDMDAVAAGDDDDVEGEDEEEAEALQERFKKLANIIKG
tara:strand:- start:441 stop:827 length:387 start_codon:yes stop_codon:yes gene_type:complete